MEEKFWIQTSGCKQEILCEMWIKTSQLEHLPVSHIQGASLLFLNGLKFSSAYYTFQTAITIQTFLRYVVIKKQVYDTISFVIIGDF